MNSEMGTGVGWYVLGQDQQLIGPYTISELQGELFVYVLILFDDSMLNYQGDDYMVYTVLGFVLQELVVCKV